MTFLQLQLSLLVITIIQLTSSQSTYDVIQQDSDVSSCGSNQQVLSQLVTTDSQLVAAISQLTTAISKLERYVTELKTGSRQKDATGRLTLFT